MGRTVTEWVLQLIDNITSPMNSVENAAESASDAVDNVVDSTNNLHNAGGNLSDTATKFGAVAFAVNQISDAVGKFDQEFQGIIGPGVELQTKMAQLSVVSGKVGDDLTSLEDKARDLGIEFGVGASAMADSFMDTIGSLGDSFGESDEALELMGRNVGTLSKLMNGDAKGAANALSTAMLQYGVDLTNPTEAAQEATRMMNIMQAAANVGGSEVVDTAEALRQSGLLAKQSGLSFEELNASLEGLAKGKIIAGEAGTAMRNILLSMSTLSNAPKEVIKGLQSYGVNIGLAADPTVKFTDRLRELQKIQSDPGLMESVFMKANIAAGQTILNNIDTIDDWTLAVTGTNAATEGAATVMDTYAEKVAKMNKKIDDLKIGFFQAIEPIAPFISIGGDVVATITNMGIAVWGLSVLLKKDLWLSIGSAIKSISTYVISCYTGVAASIKFGLASFTSFAAFKTAAVSACTTVSAAISSIPIIGWIALAITAIAALVTYFYNTSEKFRGFIWGLWESIKAVFTNIGNFIKEVLLGCWEIMQKVFNPANWFNDDVSISDGLDRITSAAKTYGEEIGKAFAQGRDAGIADFNAEKAIGKESSTPFSQPGSISASDFLSGSGAGGSKPISGGKGGKGSGSGEKGLNLSGSGSGGKSITMNVTMNNYLTGLSVDEIVNKVCRQINDRLSDSLAMQ